MRNKVGTPKKRTQRRNRRRASYLFWSWGPPGRREQHCELMGGHTWRYGSIRRFGIDQRTCAYCYAAELGNRRFVNGHWTWKPSI